MLANLGCCDDRKIRIGISDVALAWTDGSSFIALDRHWLGNISLHNIGNVLNMFSTLCHELAHDSNSGGTHNHGPEFYEKYYEITQLNYWKNPLYHVYSFSEYVKKQRIEENRIKEDAKELEMKESLTLVTS